MSDSRDVAVANHAALNRDSSEARTEDYDADVSGDDRARAALNSAVGVYSTRQLRDELAEHAQRLDRLESAFIVMETCLKAYLRIEAHAAGGTLDALERA